MMLEHVSEHIPRMWKALQRFNITEGKYIFNLGKSGVSSQALRNWMESVHGSVLVDMEDTSCAIQCKQEVGLLMSR